MSRVFIRQSSNDCQAPLQFWLCADTGFRGCCAVDACANKGCPTSSSTTGSAASAAPSKSNTSSATPAQSSTVSATIETRTATPAQSSAVDNRNDASAHPNAKNSSPHSQTNIGLIIGLALAGLFILVLITAFILHKRRKARQQAAFATIDKKERIEADTDYGPNRDSTAKDWGHGSWMSYVLHPTQRHRESSRMSASTAKSPIVPSYGSSPVSNTGAFAGAAGQQGQQRQSAVEEDGKDLNGKRESIPALDGRSIYEMPITFPRPVEMDARPDAGVDDSLQGRRWQWRQEDGAEHSTSWAALGAERNEIGKLSGNLR